MPHRARPVKGDLAATAVPLHRQGTSPATASSPRAAPAPPKGDITKLIDPLLVVLVSVRMLVRGR